MSARAELLADRGAAAESDELFRSRPFLDAEAVTHTLRIDTGDTTLVAPLIVRNIPPTGLKPTHSDGNSPVGGVLDASSPYGYPGLVEGGRGDARLSNSGEAQPGIPSAPLDPGEIDFSATGLVTIFIRHTLLEPVPLAGTSERNVVQIADPELPRKSRGSDRNRVNKNRKLGYETKLIPGPQTTAEQRAGFLAAYEQTMRRTGAAERYFFGAAYFDRLLASPRTWLALALAPGGDVAAASILAESDGFLHYYLSGSADAQLRDSPMKNVVSALVDLAEERGQPLNLGGGLSRGDALEEFKRGFANRELAWRTSELVCDRDAYRRLSADREGGGFFPAYRAPLS